MTKKINSYIINLKIQSDLSGDDRIIEYIRIVKELSTNKNVLMVSKNEAIQMYAVRGGNGQKIPEFIYGHIARGIYIQDKEIDVIQGDKIVKNENTPQILKPIVCDFLFIPKKHRLVVEKVAGGPTEKHIENYLNEFLPKYVRKEDKLEIVVEKDVNVIEQIFEAKSVFKLSYEISYTNDDVVEQLGEDFEDIIKESKIGNLKLTAEADNHIEGLNVEESILLGGGLELAKSNGTILSAKIIPKGGKKIKTISNIEKPKILPVEIDLDLGGKFRLWFNEIMKLL